MTMNGAVYPWIVYWLTLADLPGDCGHTNIVYVAYYDVSTIIEVSIVD